MLFHHLMLNNKIFLQQRFYCTSNHSQNPYSLQKPVFYRNCARQPAEKLAFPAQHAWTDPDRQIIRALPSASTLARANTPPNLRKQGRFAYRLIETAACRGGESEWTEWSTTGRWRWWLLPPRSWSRILMSHESTGTGSRSRRRTSYEPRNATLGRGVRQNVASLSGAPG